MISNTVLRVDLFQGNDSPLYITTNINTSVFDLTGGTVWFTVKRRLTDPDNLALIQKISPTSAAIVDPTQGLIRININSADTLKAPPLDFPPWYQNFPFDIQIKDGNGKILTFATGTVSYYPTFTLTKS